MKTNVHCTKSVSETIAELKVLIREKLDPLGYVDYGRGAFVSGHVPHVAPSAYLCTWYAGLDEEGIKAAEEECGRYIPPSYRELLSHLNGARLLGISLYGTVDGFMDRSGQGIGQPISIWYQNSLKRPNYIPEGHLGIGAINGAWFSQGHLYLTSVGEVELRNAEFDMVGARWNSLADFLADEVPRRFSLYDATGAEIKGAKLLPGDTDDWEQIAKEADKRKKVERSFVRRVLKALRRH